MLVLGLNRPGFPGDSISGEIMELWADLSCLHRRFGNGLSGWCWSTGGAPLGVGGDLFGCASETLRLWVLRAERDQDLRPG